MASSISDDLAVCYRKAKVDIFRSTDPRLLDICRYENQLEEKLERLAQKIESSDTEWIYTKEFLGIFQLIPDFIDPGVARVSGVTRSGPRDTWRFRKSEGDGPKARFRPYSRCSIDFHVLSTYWMMRVGTKLESRLGKEAYGNRLRRDANGEFSRLSVGSFQYYVEAYGSWRDNGMRAMRSALEAEVPVIALTADVTQFYHRLDPSFLVNADFLERIGVELTSEEERINRLFVEALVAWSRMLTPDEPDGTSQVAGLPVGVPASAVVANVALFELDEIVRNEFGARYYGRYVDDVILVLSGDRNFGTARELWEWLSYRSRDKMKVSDRDGSEGGGFVVRYDPGYLGSSVIEFSNEKNKVFDLSVESGIELLDEIQRNLDERSSAWRSFSSISDDSEYTSQQIARVVRDNGDGAYGLRDADRLSVRRSDFAILLRDFEAYSRDLVPGAWSEARGRFFSAVKKYILVLPHFFEFADYLPRMIQLAVATEDWNNLKSLLEGMIDVVGDIANTCSVEVKSHPWMRDADEILDRWCIYMDHVIVENVVASISLDADLDSLAWVTAGISKRLSSVKGRLGSVRNIVDLVSDGLALEFYVRDLARSPLRHELLGNRARPINLGLWRGYVMGSKVPLEPSLREAVRDFVSELQFSAQDRRIVRSLPGILFATRPISQWELYSSIRWMPGSQGNVKGPEKLRKISSILTGFRGYKFGYSPVSVDTVDGSAEIKFERHGNHNDKVRVALVTMHTDEDAWIAAAIGRPCATAERYEGFKAIFREALSRTPRPDYVLIPECAVPSAWFGSFAQRLGRSGVSLVAGVEYLQAKGEMASEESPVVHNQVWMSLAVGRGSAGSVLPYVQDKQAPAPHEESRLLEIRQIVMKPEVKWSSPPMICHGDFWFATLVCSELTDISNRYALRGRVDALFVVEWNPDIHSFEALVDSAALDIHAIIAQVNHRKYGDSRIRSPRSKDYERDVVRVRGGDHDHVLVGTIQYGPLRAHQSAHFVSGGEFKPVPAGFSISESRRRLPAAGKRH